METNSKNSIAALLNLSALSQYFFPFGNFIFPIVIWASNKDKSEFVDRQGKEAINFQLSLFLYSVVLALIAIPCLLVAFLDNGSFTALMHDNEVTFDNFNFEAHAGLIVAAITAMVLFGFLKIAEFFLIIDASVKTSNGASYKYPLTIPFIR